MVLGAHLIFVRLTCSLKKIEQLFIENWENYININNVVWVLIYYVAYHKGTISFLVQSLYFSILALTLFL